MSLKTLKKDLSVVLAAAALLLGAFLLPPPAHAHRITSGRNFLQSGNDGDSSTTESDSGFELIGRYQSLLRGCSDNQVLKWDETEDDWNCENDVSGSGGSAIALDLDDDDSDESSDLTEIATFGDDNNIFTEPADDKLEIDVGQPWPTADLANALSANGSNCSAGSAPLGVDASGAAESCTDFEEDLSNSAGLAGALSDETGTGASVFATSPTLVTPALGTPSALVLTNATGLPSGGIASTFITGFDAVGTFESGDTFPCNEAGVGIRECDFDDLPSASGTPGGTNEDIQFNDSGSFGGTDDFIWNGTSVALGDDIAMCFGAFCEFQIDYDDSVDDQLLFRTSKEASQAITDPMVEFLYDIDGTGMTANQQIFGLAVGSQASNTPKFTVDEDGDGVFAGALAISGAFTGATIDPDLINDEDQGDVNISSDVWQVQATQANAVDSDSYVDGSIDVEHHADDVITHAKIADADQQDSVGILIETPVDADDFLFHRFDEAVTVTGIDCIVEDSTSAVVVIVECDADGDNCGTSRMSESLTCAVTNTADDGTIGESGIVAGARLRAQVGTVTGTPGHVNVTVYYTWDD